MPFCRICSKAPFLNPPHFPVAWPHWRQVSYGPDVITFEYNTAENIWLKEGNLGIEHHTSFEALFVGAESCEMCHFIQLSASRVIEACTDENASSHITKYIGRPTGPLWIYHRVRLDLGIPQDYSHDHGFAVLSPITANQGTAILLAAFGFCVNQGKN